MAEGDGQNPGIVSRVMNSVFPGIGIEGGTGPQPTPPGHGNPNDPNDPNPQLLPDPPVAKFNPVTGEQILEPDPTAEPKDPLAEYGDLFDNKKLEANVQEALPSSQDILNPENMGKIMENIPAFTTHLTDETKAAMAAGGEEGGKAIMTAFNEISQGAYKTALTHSVALSEKMVDQRMARMEETISDRINQHNITNTIQSSDAIKNSPVLQAGISILADRLRATNPTAPPEWIAQQATKFFMDSAAVLGGGQPGQPGGQPGNKPGEPDIDPTDWIEFATQSGRDQS